MPLSPIALFTYKRLATLQKTLESLRANFLAPESELYIFSDGPKTKQDTESIELVRSYLRNISGFKAIHIKESPVNKGLANSIICGVSEILKLHNDVIVLEDDLFTTPNFLNFMNQALKNYENNDKVFSISGYSYPFAIPENYHYDAFAVTRGCSWGWATWRSRWKDVDWEVTNFSSVKADKNYFRKLNFSGSDLIAMLKKQREGKVDSWAIRWYFHQFQNDKLTVYPVRSFVSNDGFDTAATNTNVYNRYKTILNKNSKKEFNFPPAQAYHPYFQKCIQRKFSIKTRIFMGKGMTFLKKLGLVKD
jgi:Glycosyl transferase family 2